MHFEPFISSAFNYLESLLVFVEIGVVVFGYMWGYYGEGNTHLERAMVAGLMAYPVGVVYAISGEVLDANLQKGSEMQMLTLHKRYLKRLATRQSQGQF